MTSEIDDADLRAAQRRLMLAWAGCSVAAVLLPALAWAPTLGERGAALDPGTLGGVHGVAVALAAGSLILRIRLLSDRRLTRLLGTHPADHDPLSRLPAFLWPAFVVGWTANLLIAALGVGFAAWTRQAHTMLPFVFAAFVLNMLACPRLAPHLRRARGLLGNR